MTRPTRYILVMVALLAACSQATPEQQIVNDAAAALGGRERIMAVKTLVMEGEGTQYNLGQDLRPESAGETFTVTAYKRAIDIAGGRARTEQTRTANFTFFAGPAPQTAINGIDGQVGYNVAANGTATRVSDVVAGDRRVELYHYPLILVRAALDPMAKPANARTEGSESIVDVTLPSGQLFKLSLDTTTKRPTRIVSMGDNTVLGDVVLETGFAEYQDVNGVQLPTRITSKTDAFTTGDIRITNQTVDGDTGDLTAPAAAASAQAVATLPPATVSVEELAKGIWYLAGQSHHSLLVEFSDHLMLIEAPQHDVRALGVIAKARELRPEKPLTRVVNSHHHFDHSGGIRAAVSEGLSVITHQGNAAFFEEIAGRPHTIVPDALARAPKPLKVEPVGEEMVIKDAAMTVILYPVSGGGHSETMLVAYFPRERLLVEADLFTPGSAVAPYAASLLDDIRKRNLRVDRIVPLHGKVGPFADLVKRAGATATN
jgi:glyoxylase-like metal-dependent hydrolase (beta-lactamase superfamily II)